MRILKRKRHVRIFNTESWRKRNHPALYFRGYFGGSFAPLLHRKQAREREREGGEQASVKRTRGPANHQSLSLSLSCFLTVAGSGSQSTSLLYPIRRLSARSKAHTAAKPLDLVDLRRS